MAASDFSEHARHLAEGLFPHQVEGVAFLLGRRRAILADDMGTGKTLVGLSVIWALCRHGKGKVR
ncbi:MAG: SNF2-related protein [Candidatus Latescibacterota bacterium]